ncbi:hypothetical protein OS493_040267 [Desmophyllum pertusum]|uniref:Uncharacterized protein n=1 Tax=Desmophyllum pertusum TaxID=174260 RepID=A0A9W9YTW9_9CNID|nr:hypothetical protein OS493_040267 [Desmophyllum pertusum]
MRRLSLGKIRLQLRTKLSLLPCVRTNSNPRMLLQARQGKEVSSEDVQARDPETCFKKLHLMSQHNQERFDLAVKHLLEHENFSADLSLLCVAKEERSQDLNRTVEATPQSHENLNNEHRGRDVHSLDPLKQRHVALTTKDPSDL